MYSGAAYKHRWGVILAGGEGVRLRSLTRLVLGDDTPKQFCPLFDGRTLLTQTKQRINRSISADRTLFVLLSAHEHFYKSGSQALAPTSLGGQPNNGGT